MLLTDCLLSSLYLSLLGSFSTDPDPEFSCSYCHESSQLMSYHSYPTLSSLAQDHRTHRVQAPLAYPGYKVLTTTQHPYLHNLISTQRPRSTRSSSVVTLARPPSSSSVKITDRSFRYASPCSEISSLCLFVNLIRAPVPPFHTHLFFSPIASSSSDSPLCTSITPSLFHSRLKTYTSFTNPTPPPVVSFLLPDCLHGLLPGPFLLRYSVFYFIFIFLIFRFWAVR